MTAGAIPAGCAAQALKFAACMRAHGITNFQDRDDRTGTTWDGYHRARGIELNSPQFQSAQQACRKLQPGRVR